MAVKTGQDVDGCLAERDDESKNWKSNLVREFARRIDVASPLVSFRRVSQEKTVNVTDSHSSERATRYVRWEEETHVSGHR